MYLLKHFYVGFKVDLNKQFQGCVVWLLENAIMGKLSVQTKGC